MRSVWFIVMAAALSMNISAQKPTPTPEPEEVLKVDTQIVDVPVVVTDRTGKPILNLKQQNFIVYEDGKQQDVSDFSATTAPFEVALLLDTSGSARDDLPLIKAAAEVFVTSLRAGDRVSIVSFDTDRTSGVPVATPDLISILTDDRTKLKLSLDKVKTSNGTPYYDSLLTVADRVFNKQPEEDFRGRRALVALTDGVDSTSSAGFAEARAKLEAEGIIVYFVQLDTRAFFEENLLGNCELATRFSQAQIKRYYATFGSGSKMERTTNFCQLGDFERLDISKKLYELADTEMNELAKTSGGKVFPVGDLNEARTAFKSVAAEIGTKYSLGYYSSNEKKDGTYRKIAVELKGLPPGAKVRAREGYTAPKN